MDYPVVRGLPEALSYVSQLLLPGLLFQQLCKEF